MVDRCSSGLATKRRLRRGEAHTTHDTLHATEAFWTMAAEGDAEACALLHYCIIAFMIETPELCRRRVGWRTVSVEYVLRYGYERTLPP
jgi:hypothetical protein